MYGGHRCAGLRMCRGGDEVEVGMAGDQAQQLASGVPARSGDGDPNSHTNLRMTMQMTVSKCAWGSNYELHCACPPQLTCTAPPAPNLALRPPPPPTA